QWTSSSHGRSLDESVLDDGFFGPPNPFPLLVLGDTGDAVSRMQTRLNVWGAKLNVDGAFGPVTETALEAFQKAHGLAADGDCGPKREPTWIMYEQRDQTSQQTLAPITEAYS